MAADISGRWATFDSESGGERSVVEIRNASGNFTGRIVELFLESDEPPDPICDLCTGAQRRQKIRGLEILFVSAVGNGDEYKGTILDPEEGRLYSCIVTLAGDGKRLSIRGYVGIPLLGRSVAWERVD